MLLFLSCIPSTQLGFYPTPEPFIRLTSSLACSYCSSIATSLLFLVWNTRRITAMRYQNWDVLLFADNSKVPIQEFKTACHVLQDPGISRHT